MLSARRRSPTVLQRAAAEGATPARVSYAYSDSVELSFDGIADDIYLTLLPDVHIHVDSTDAVDKDVIKAVKRDILWRQRNAEFWDAIKNWRKKLFGNDGWRVVYPPGAKRDLNSQSISRGHYFRDIRPPVPEALPRQLPKRQQDSSGFRPFKPMSRICCSRTAADRDIPLRALSMPVVHSSRLTNYSTLIEIFASVSFVSRATRTYSLNF